MGNCYWRFNNIVYEIAVALEQADLRMWSRIPTSVADALKWPNDNNWLLGLFLLAALILLLTPASRWISRIVRSVLVGLVSGVTLVTALATILYFTPTSGSKFHHPTIYLCVTVLYLIGTFIMWSSCRSDLDHAKVMRQLNIPRGQSKFMRSTVVPDDVFAAVLDNPSPISDWNQDWIGRATFVDAVLQRVINDEEPVVAITGGFGEGKSSVLSLIKTALEPCQEIVSVEFSSTPPGGEQTLVASLFSSITNAIRVNYIVPGLRRDFFRYGRTVAEVIPKMGESLKDFFERPSQSEELADLRLILSRVPVRVVILLDEIDRLQDDELKALLKLLRGVADLPRLRFICAFNKTAVCRAIAGKDTKRGNEYLEVLPGRTDAS